MEQLRNWKYWKLFKIIVLWGTIIICTVLMVSLCFDEGLDYDESYSYYTVYKNSVIEVAQTMLQDRDTHPPLWHCWLRVWTLVFGESWFAFKMCSVAGTFCTLLLGATKVRRHWGYKTALMFVLPVGLGPSILQASVNVRMYPWTIFLTTLSALLAYELIKKQTGKKWILFTIVNLCVLYSHFFTVFVIVLIYLYLFIELLATKQKKLWSYFISGFCSGGAFVFWVFFSKFFEEGGRQSLSLRNFSIKSVFEFYFKTNIEYSVLLGFCLVVVALLGSIILKKRFEKREWVFTITCLTLFLSSYSIIAILSSVADHFFIVRHIMHPIALLWLGIAIVISRTNISAYLFALMFIAINCFSSYRISHAREYDTIPYLEETKQFITDNMEEGDIVICNTEKKFMLIFAYYMPDQILVHIDEIENLQEYAGKRVWFFYSTSTYFGSDVIEQYGIESENMGHYGFQIIDNFTQFDLFKLEIRGVK